MMAPMKSRRNACSEPIQAMSDDERVGRASVS